jgi:hypothetical protein
MNEEHDAFKDYYEETTRKLPKGETGSEIISDLESKADEDPKKKDVTGDENIIRAPINAFIKNMNALIGKVYDEETEKKTRTDLIITMVIGGMAYTVANLYYLITINHKAKMSADEFEATFIGMYHTAIKDIGKKEGQP